MENKKSADDLRPYDGHVDLDGNEPLKTNRFIVHFPDNFPIKSYHVEKLKKPECSCSMFNLEVFGTKLQFTFRNLGIPDIKVKEYWSLFNYDKHPYIIVEDLSPDLKPISKEYYTNPTVTWLKFGECDYTKDDVRKYTLVMDFDEVLSGDAFNKLHKKL